MADPSMVCPKSIECPDCHAQPGARCCRPSGHLAHELHAARVTTAEAMTKPIPQEAPVDH